MFRKLLSWFGGVFTWLASKFAVVPELEEISDEIDLEEDKVISAGEVYTRLQEEARVVEGIVRRYLGPVAAAMGINWDRVPRIVVRPTDWLWGGYGEPQSSITLYTPAGVPICIQLASIRYEGYTASIEGEQVFYYFEPGSEEYIRIVVEDLATQLAHVLHEDGFTPLAAFDASEQKARQVGYMAAVQVLGPPAHPAWRTAREVASSEPTLN